MDLSDDSALPGRDSSDSEWKTQFAPPAVGRSLGIWLLVLADLALAALALFGVRIVSGASEYASQNSADIGSELEAALAGLTVMRIGLYALAGGFIVSALAAVSLTRIGYTIQLLWAVLVCLSLVGLPYGVPALVFLARKTTRARFFGSPSGSR